MSRTIESLIAPQAQAVLSARPVEFDEAPESAQASGGRELARDHHPLHAVRVRLQVCVGEASMTVGEVLQAREGEVLLLDRTIEQPVDLLVEGKVVARGQLVAVDGAFAVRVTELPLPLKL